MDQALAARVRKIRKHRKISQEELSKRIGVSHGSVKWFDDTGQISLLSLTKSTIALDCAGESRGLFTRVFIRRSRRSSVKTNK